MVDEDEDDKNTENAEGEEGDGDGEGKKGSRKKLILFTVLPLVLLVAAGAGAYFAGALDGLLGKTAQECVEVENEHGEMVEECHDVVKGAEGEHTDAAAATPGHFLKVPELIVNLSSADNQPRFLKISVELEVESEEDLTSLDAVMPRIKDHFQTYLRELRVEDLRGSAGIYRLRLELLSRVGAAAPGVKVRDVLFQEILIQ